MTNITRISLSLGKTLMTRIDEIPEGLRSAIMRNLLEAYFDFSDHHASALGRTLKGKIIISERMDETSRPQRRDSESHR